MSLRTLMLSLAVVGGLSAVMCNGRTPLPGLTCSQGVALPPQGLPLTAAAFVAMAAAGDQFEIQSSQIALAKTYNADISNFAQMLINDHTLLDSQVVAAATASGLAAPVPVLSADQQRMINELQVAPAGSVFDQLWLRDQIMAHEMALALHSNYATAGDTPALRAVAASAVPTVQNHLNSAEQLSVANGVVGPFCPATNWCNSDFDAYGQSFSVCCPSDVPVFPPVSVAASIYSAPVTATYASAPVATYPYTTYAAPSYAATYAAPSFAATYAAPSYTATYAAPSYTAYAAPSYTTTYAATPYTTQYAAPYSTPIYASTPASSIYTPAGYVRAFGTVVPASTTAGGLYGNVPVGTSTTALYTVG